MERRAPVIVKEPFRHVVRVEMHLPGGFTRVILFALAHGDLRWDIPTECIPPHLRPIGSEFLVIMPRFTPEPGDTPDAIREICRQVQVEELNRK
jgi:hypothetical protein